MNNEDYFFRPCCWMIFRTGATKHPDLCSTHMFFLPISKRTCGIYVAQHKTKSQKVSVGVPIGIRHLLGFLDSSICWIFCRVVRLPLRIGTISQQNHSQRQTLYLCQHLRVKCSKGPNNICANNLQHQSLDDLLISRNCYQILNTGVCRFFFFRTLHFVPI